MRQYFNALLMSGRFASARATRIFSRAAPALRPMRHDSQ